MWKNGPLRNGFQKPPMIIAAQDDNLDGRIRAKIFFVFKDGFDQWRSAQRMKILSLKTAAHFWPAWRKSFAWNFWWIRKVLIYKRAAIIAFRSLSDLTLLRRTIVEKNLPLKDNFLKRLRRKTKYSIGSKKRFDWRTLCFERKIQTLTMCKHKTACDARGSVRSFFGKAFILDIYKTER